MKCQPAPGNRVQCWIIRLALLSILAFSLSACSNEKPSSTPSSESREQKEAEVSDAAPSLDQGSERETSSGVLDRGKECKEHYYVLEPGAEETLEFSTLLPLGEKKRPTEFREDGSGIEGTGVSMRLNSVTYEDYTETYDVWALDYGRHYQEVLEEIEKKKKEKPGARFEIQITGEVRIGSFNIGLNHDLEKGIAVIRKLGNHHSPQAVGRLSREEVGQLLGLQNANEPISFQDKFLNKPVSVSLIESREERSRSVMNYSVLVRTPGEGGIRDLRKRIFQFIPDSSGRGMGVGVASAWGRNPDPNALYFLISGPAEEVQCFSGQ